MSTPSIVPAPGVRHHPADPLARRVAFALLDHLGEGGITLIEGGTPFCFGPGGNPELSATVVVHSPHAYTAVLRGTAALTRAYVDRLWDCDDITALVRILVRNLGTLDAIRDRAQPLLGPAVVAAGWVRRNTRRRSRRRVRAHYDIGDDLFTAMLDETMAYSCGVFPHPGASLLEASITKMEMVCSKLQLSSSDHLLEIGTGWGGLAIHAAARYGCRVTTTTISRNQFDRATEEVRKAGLQGSVEVLLEDYRDLRGTYDKLVSIEMVEAVGWQNFDTYFGRCARRLRSDGAMLLQAITTSDGLYRRWRSGTGLANAVIFPGGSIPSLEAILGSVARSGDMRVTDLEDITPHYATTLRHWRERFLARRSELDAQRYDARFCRLWEFYLAYCEGAFAERRIQDVQLLLVRPEHGHESRKGTGRIGDPDLRVVRSA